MRSTLEIISCLLANLLRTYETHLFYEAFMSPVKTVKNRFPFYLIYFILTSVTVIYINIPILTLSVNILSMVAITFLYKADIKKRLLGFVFLFGVCCICETVIALLSGVISLSYLERFNFSSTVGVIGIPILPFILILLYRGIPEKRNNVMIPPTYYIMAVSVPGSCTYVALVCFTIEGIRTWQLGSIAIIMFAMMISVFWLYEKQMRFYSEDNKKKILEVQNVYYQKQLEYMLLSEQATRSLRHDMKNHLLSICALAKENNDPAVIQYVNDLHHLSSPAGDSISSGNIVIDSILNSKLSLAAERGIDLRFDIVVPEKLSVDDIDITILLGNLLDNALENFDAASGYPILFRLRYDKGRLLFHCENPYAGTLKKRGRSYNTGKSDQKNHGFGLQNINNVVNKYNGELTIKDENNIFCADILLYL